MKKTYEKTYDKWVFHGMTPFFHPPPKGSASFPDLKRVFFHVWPVFFLTSEDEDTTGSHRRSPRPLASPMFSREWNKTYPPAKEKGDFLWNRETNPPCFFIGWKIRIYRYLITFDRLLDACFFVPYFGWRTKICELAEDTLTWASRQIILSPTAEISTFSNLFVFRWDTRNKRIILKNTSQLFFFNRTTKNFSMS